MPGTGINNANNILRAFFSGVSLTTTGTVYMDLMTTATTNANNGQSLGAQTTAYNNYARVPLAAGAAWTVTTNGVTNAQAITWNTVPNAVTTTAPVIQVALYGSSTGTDLLWFEDIPSAFQKTFSAGDVPQLAAGALTLTLN